MIPHPVRWNMAFDIMLVNRLLDSLFEREFRPRRIFNEKVGTRIIQFETNSSQRIDKSNPTFLLSIQFPSFHSFSSRLSFLSRFFQRGPIGLQFCLRCFHDVNEGVKTHWRSTSAMWIRDKK